MKIKETLSNDFKRGDTMSDTDFKILKEFEDIILTETIYRKGDLGYSKFILYDCGGNVSYITIKVADPREKDLYKDLYLRYQNEAKQFMLEIFDVFVGKEKDIKMSYYNKRKTDFEYEQKEDRFGTVWVTPIDDDFIFADISFLGKETNLRTAEELIKLFEGKETDFSFLSNYIKNEEYL